MRLARHITRFAIPFRAATRLPCVIRVIPAAATPRVRRPVVRAASGLVALERELDELHRVEEALGCRPAIAAGQPVYRSPSAPPPAVLGVRVADKLSRAA